MKCKPAIPAAICLGLAACDTMNQPITSSGSYDPLRTPSSQQPAAAAASSATTFAAGQFVRAIMDNTAFFSKRPKGNADADKLLKSGTSMKVITPGESYVKVELDSGEVGWVPTVMLEDMSATAPQGNAFAPPNPGEFQVYPPTGGYGGELPPVSPAEMPPEGAIPTVIDPEAPTHVAPVPPITVPGDPFAAPAAETPPAGDADATPETDPAAGNPPAEANPAAAAEPPAPAPNPAPGNTDKTAPEDTKPAE